MPVARSLSGGDKMNLKWSIHIYSHIWIRFCIKICARLQCALWVSTRSDMLFFCKKIYHMQPCGETGNSNWRFDLPAGGRNHVRVQALKISHWPRKPWRAGTYVWFRISEIMDEQSRWVQITFWWYSTLKSVCDRELGLGHWDLARISIGLIWLTCEVSQRSRVLWI